MGETWAGGRAAGDGDEAGIRGLGLVLGAESLGDSVAPDTRRFTAGCPAAIPAGTAVVERYISPRQGVFGGGLYVFGVMMIRRNYNEINAEWIYACNRCC